MYEDDVEDVEDDDDEDDEANFSSGSIYINLSFRIKKSNSKYFAHAGFCAPKMSQNFDISSWYRFLHLINFELSVPET